MDMKKPKTISIKTTAYDHLKIEKKWQKKWMSTKLYKTVDDSSKEKFYILDMFPYPSGEGLHVGHPKGYIATDIISRYQRMNGKSVLHPMGFDAFGLPAENYAIKTKTNPADSVKKNVARYKKQLEILGFDYDWSREINTTDPQYYRWTQWIFLQLFKKGLAYESYEPINWCPVDKTGLANEDVVDGRCERCGTLVEKKPMRQWVLKITDYAERLLKDLDLNGPDGKPALNWPESIKEAQRNWIGKSEGALIKFPCVIPVKTGIQDQVRDIEVFTTRPDTLFGVTYIVLAPEHKLVQELLSSVENKKEVENYIAKVKGETEIERTDATKEKTGVELKGIKVINPANQEEVPVWIADYVLAEYGTGAVMAVPAHDERDSEFAKKFGLPVRQVVKNPQGDTALPFVTNGVIINSDKFSEKNSDTVKKEITSLVNGKWVTKYKLRDWVFSRQRYWGEPMPLIHCENCALRDPSGQGVVAVPEEDLPVKLPKVESYEPTGTGESPLAAISKWVNVKCPNCKGKAKRETNTMPQWAGSSWYYIAYCISENLKSKLPISKQVSGLEFQDKMKYWLPVDFYVGGAEHATRHLIYARFWHKFLFDIGVVSTIEPFKKLQSVGLIMGEDGRKMSKRFGNVVNPDDIVATYGADTMRIYEMFMGPFDQQIAWNTDSMIGSRRFIERVWKLKDKVVSRQSSVDSQTSAVSPSFAEATAGKQNEGTSPEPRGHGPIQGVQGQSTNSGNTLDSLARGINLLIHLRENDKIKNDTSSTGQNDTNRILHKTIKKVSDDILAMRFNTAISTLMIAVNEFEKLSSINKENFEVLLKLVAPFAPHMTEELWETLGNKESIHTSEWPVYNAALAVDNESTIVVQVNGKARGSFKASIYVTKENLEVTAKTIPDVSKWLEGKEIKKVVVVPNRLVNFVV